MVFGRLIVRPPYGRSILNVSLQLADRKGGRWVLLARQTIGIQYQERAAYLDMDGCVCLVVLKLLEGRLPS